MNKWQPINTAPKDRPVFVTWRGTTSRAIGRVAVFQEMRGRHLYQSGGWEDCGPGWVCYYTGTILSDLIDFWMELPEKPNGG